MIIKAKIRRSNLLARNGDVRAFGHLFAFKDKKAKDKKNRKTVEKNEEVAIGSDASVSIGIRGPVSVHPAFSIDLVSITSMQITKSVNGEDVGSKKGSDTMGMKHRVDQGTYVFYGSINPQQKRGRSRRV